MLKILQEPKTAFNTDSMKHLIIKENKDEANDFLKRLKLKSSKKRKTLALKTINI